MEEMDNSNMSKSQRKKFKKEQKSIKKEEDKMKQKKESRNKKIKTSVLTLIVILSVFAFIYVKSVPATDGPIIEITPSVYNFGSISQAKGVVDTEVTISNKGTEPLILNNMDSSCGCTSASLIYNEIEGPRFSMSMHGTNPKNWEQVIPPGESAQLKIYYDPNVHKDLRGAVTRSIYVFSNDPRNAKKEVRIKVIQVN